MYDDWSECTATNSHIFLLCLQLRESLSVFMLCSMCCACFFSLSHPFALSLLTLVWSFGRRSSILLFAFIFSALPSCVPLPSLALSWILLDSIVVSLQKFASSTVTSSRYIFCPAPNVLCEYALVNFAIDKFIQKANWENCTKRS